MYMYNYSASIAIYTPFISPVEMNAESSRSHLVVGVVLESKNLSNGTVHKGKVRML